MASVYKHKKRGYQVRWKLFFPDGSCANKYRYIQNRVEADRVCRDCDFMERGSRAGNLSVREITQARRDGLITEQEARTLSGGKVVSEYDLQKVIDEYRSSIAVSHTDSALCKTLCRIKFLAEWFKKHPIPLLSVSDIKKYVLDRREGRLAYTNAKTGFARIGVSAKTISNELQIMSGIVNEAIRLGMTEANPVKDVHVPIKTDRLRRALSLSEVGAVISAAAEHRHLLHGQIYEFIHVALFTGFRRSELRTLCWDDINFDTRRIVIQSKQIDGEPDFTPKSGTARFKSIPDKIMPLLEGMERRGRFVFGGDKPYNVDSISQVVRLLMRRAGLVGVSLHHCRHTYGSWLLRKTGDLSFVQGEMGHLDISTTKKYIHTIEDASDPARTFDYE